MASQKSSTNTCLERCLFLVFNLPELTYKRGKTAAEICELFTRQGYEVTLRTVQRYLSKLMSANIVTLAGDDGRTPTYCRNFKG